MLAWTPKRPATLTRKGEPGRIEVFYLLDVNWLLGSNRRKTRLVVLGRAASGPVGAISSTARRRSPCVRMVQVASLLPPLAD